MNSTRTLRWVLFIFLFKRDEDLTDLYYLCLVKQIAVLTQRLSF